MFARQSVIVPSIFLFAAFVSFLIISCGRVESVMDYQSEKPEDNRFTKVILEENLDEPVMFQFISDSVIVIAERRGKIKVLNTVTKQLDVVADIPVSVGYYSQTGEELAPTGEDGMLGMILDPAFQHNHWIYLYYSPEGGKHRSILARYEWKDKQIDMSSEKALLEVPNQRESCCHLGGGMVFDSEGNLLLSTGDNTPNDPRGYSPLDERTGRSRFDAQRSSSNTNDFRGKILRIKPEIDGSYSIPQGNLFAKDMDNVRPEIYTMGNRNPWRLSIDSKTGWIYWGEVGPGGTVDSVGMGPKSYDEFNQARNPGNFGWPYFSGNNQAYWRYDYATNTSLEKFDDKKPVNLSPNNTGLQTLPEAQPAFIWYPQMRSAEFPLMGSGSNSAVGGPVFHLSDFNNPKRPFPAYYEGKWFITDWTRGWIMVITMDENGNYQSMEPFLPEINLSGPIDMKFGADGDLYVLEYGRNPYAFSPDARLIKIEYNSGNRKPVVQVAADKKVGAIPLRVAFSSRGTLDHDEEQLSYEWKIVSEGNVIKTFSEPDPVFTFHEAGRYRALLTVSDPRGARDSSAVEIMAGNEPPAVKIDFLRGNKSFFFPGDTIHYSVDVTDREDGSLSGRQIPPDKVTVSVDYLNATGDFPDISKSLANVNASTPLLSVIAEGLIKQSDCSTCHKTDAKSVGPAFTTIAQKYKTDANATGYLLKKIISGGSGVWGEMEMPPHPTLTESTAGILVQYILSFGKGAPRSLRMLPVKGQYIIPAPPKVNRSVFGNADHSKYVFRASYTDKGTIVAPKDSSVDAIMLRSPQIPVTQADKFDALLRRDAINPDYSTISPEKPGAYLGIDQIDLTGINAIEFEASVPPEADQVSGWVIEVRVGAPNGKLVGKTGEIAFAKRVPAKDRPKILATLTGVSGVYDLYFVFINNDLKDENNRVQIRALTFMR